MTTTILYDDREAQIGGAQSRQDELWVPADQLEAASGWHQSAQGICQADACIPVPAGAGWVEGGAFNLSAFAAHRRQGTARDTERDIWSFGPAPESRLRSGIAPDFTLPDFAGREHSLSDYRGKKVLLMTWASW